MNSKSDFEMSEKEVEFLNSHSDVCSKCARYVKSNQGINLMRNCTIDPVVSDQFDSRLIRLAKASHSRRSFQYWAPAFLGAGIAAIAILATIQLVSKPSNLPVFRGSGEARKSSAPMFPTPGFSERTSRTR